MSHYSEFTTAIKDPECLVDALVGMGWTREQIEVHDTPVALVGYQSKVRAQKAHVVVRREHVGSASNDLGWEMGADGTFAAHISDFDKSKYNETWRSNLFEHYCQGIATKALKGLGCKVITRAKTTDANNVQMVGTLTI